MNVDLIRQYAELLAKERKASARHDALKRERLDLEPAVRNELIDNGVQNLPIQLDGGRKMTVYLNPTTYARPKEGVEREQVVEALKRAGCGWIVKEGYNSNSLDAWVRERLGDEKKPLPPTLAEVLDVQIVTKVAGRSSSGTKSKTSKVQETLNR